MTTFGCLRKGHAVIDSRTIVIASLSDEPRLLKLRSFLYSPGDPRSDSKDRPITGVAGRRPTMSFNASAYKELNSAYCPSLSSSLLLRSCAPSTHPRPSSEYESFLPSPYTCPPLSDYSQNAFESMTDCCLTMAWRWTTARGSTVSGYKTGKGSKTNNTSNLIILQRGNSGNSEVFVPARLCSGRGLNQSFRYPFRLTDHPGGFNLFRAKYNTRNEVTDTLDPLRW